MSHGQAPPGQAPLRHLSTLGRLLLGVFVALPLLLGLAVGVLAWRLSTGPIESSFLARRIEANVNQPDIAARIAIRRAAIAWQGWRGDGAPLEIRLSGVVLRDRQGTTRGNLPDASITLALAPLLRGIIAPATIELLRPSFVVLRDAQGGLSLDLGERQDSAGRGGGDDGTAAMLGDLMDPAEERATHTSLRRIRVTGGEVAVRDLALGRDWMLKDPQIELRRLPEGGIEGDGEAVLRVGGVDLPVHLVGRVAGAPMRFSVRFDLPVLRPADLSELLPPLSPLAILDARVAIQATGEFDATGRPLGFGLTLLANEGGDLRLDGQTRLPFARLAARLTGHDRRISLDEAVLNLAGAEGTTLSVDGQIQRGSEGWNGALRAGVERLDLAELPRLWPEGLAPESREAARIALPRGTLRDATLRLDLMADAALSLWRPVGGSLAVAMAEARLVGPNGASVEIDNAEFNVTASPTLIRLETLALRLAAPERPAGRPVATASNITASGAASLADGRWRGTFNLGLDRVSFADLPVLWPEGIGAGARSWITANVTAGEITNGRWQFAAETTEGFAQTELTALSGEAAVQQATVHWLRPMPPVRGVAARASFGLTEITVQATGGRLENEARQPTSLEVRGATLRFLLPADAQPRTEMSIQLAGALTETVTVLRHPRLRLFDRRPFPVQVAAGTQEGRVNIAFPLVADLTMEMVRIQAEARVSNARLTRLLFGRDLEDANFELTTDGDQLRLNGAAVLNATPVRIGVEMDFRAGPATQIVARETLTARADAQRIAQLGFDAGGLLTGPVALEARTERRRNGQYVVNLRGDLRDAVLAFPPLGWTKPAGSPGLAEAVLRLQGEQLTSIEGIRIEALELALRARAVARAGRIERVELQETAFGGSRMVGDARAPTAAGGPWSVTLRGPVLDLRSIFGPAGHTAGGAARDREAAPPAETTQPPLSLDLRFDQVMLAPGRDLFAIQGRGRVDAAGVLREANLRGRTARLAGGFEITMTPRGEARLLRGTAEDGGALLRSFGLIGTIDGGRLQVNAQYAESRPGAPLTGTAELDAFTVRDAPALGKLLQAMTLFGLVEAVQGGAGLVFNRAVVPFTLTPEELRISDARAFSASLGLTARGRVLRERTILDLDGTIVPAYFFNTLLGNLPLIGRLFSPEAGGGVFAATFRAQGPPDDAEISVNPLAALTPGFLRGLFGLPESGRAPR